MRTLNLSQRGLHVVGQSMRTVVEIRDRFWSGVWWTEWRRRRQEALMAKVLEDAGEDSMAARTVTERHRWLERGVKYWRPSPPLVVAALEASERAGVSRRDLRILALNRDVRQVGDEVRVRRAWWAPVLAYSALILILCHWALLSALVVFSPATWIAKLTGVAAISCLYWFLWPGFGLYSTRAYVAVKRSGTAVEEAARIALPSRAPVVPLNAQLR
jgi:hypothetical protein